MSKTKILAIVAAADATVLEKFRTSTDPKDRELAEKGKILPCFHCKKSVVIGPNSQEIIERKAREGVTVLVACNPCTALAMAKVAGKGLPLTITRSTAFVEEMNKEEKS
jgi:hypothetical protein